MSIFKNRKSLRTFFKSRYFIVILLIVAFLAAKGAYNAYLRYERSQEAVDRIQAERSGLEERESALEKTLKGLETPEGVDRELRSNYGMVKDGEDLIIIVNDDTNAGTETQTKKGWFG